jgi:hypothetical protein
MKWTISIALLILLTVSALAVYVFAQTLPEKQQGEVRKAEQDIDRFYQEKQKAVRRTLLQVQEPKNPEEAQKMFQELINGFRFPNGLLVSLCTAKAQHNEYEGLPDSFQGGKLRIEMKDGSAQEIDLKNVTKMTVK